MSTIKAHRLQLIKLRILVHLLNPIKTKLQTQLRQKTHMLWFMKRVKSRRMGP